MEGPETFTLEVRDASLVVRLHRALTLEIADDFRGAVVDRLTRGQAYRGVVVDLSGCEYLDSTGIGAFIVIKMKYKHAERLRLAKVTPVVQRIFRATGFDLVIPLEPDVETALTHLPDETILLAR